MFFLPCITLALVAASVQAAANFNSNAELLQWHKSNQAARRLQLDRRAPTPVANANGETQVSISPYQTCDLPPNGFSYFFAVITTAGDPNYLNCPYGNTRGFGNLNCQYSANSTAAPGNNPPCPDRSVARTDQVGCYTYCPTTIGTDLTLSLSTSGTPATGLESLGGSPINTVCVYVNADGSSAGRCFYDATTGEFANNSGAPAEPCPSKTVSVSDPEFCFGGKDGPQ